MNGRLFVSWLLLIAGAVSRPALAQCPPGTLPRLSPPEAGPLDQFGSAAAAVGTTAVLGARHADGRETKTGAIYVYEWNGSSWMPTRKLWASDGVAGDRFGDAVAMWEDWILVGAPGRDDSGASSGAAYVFKRSPGGEFVEIAKLLAPNGGADDRFGAAVSIDDDLALVGAFGSGRRAPGAGAAYLFDMSNGAISPIAELTASDAAEGDSFGIAVGVEEELALIGATGSDAAGADSGAAYLFQKVGGAWTETAKLTAADGAAGDRYGAAISLCPEYTMIGAPRGDGAEPDAGAAYLVLFPGLGEVVDAAKLTAPDGRAGDRFGHAVAVRGYRILVGAPGMDAGSGPTGAAYAYNPNGLRWDGVRLAPTDGAAGDSFGSSVALGPDTAFAGAIDADVAGPGSGCAYAYSGIDAFDVRAGNVNAREGEPTNVLFVNGSAGSPVSRTLRLDPGAPFELRIDTPPSMPSGARYAVFVWRSEPTFVTCEELPRGTGHIAMPTPLTGGSPRPAFVANRLGHDARLGADSWPAPTPERAPAILARAPSGIGRAMRLYAQGLVRDARSPNGVMAVTNGVYVVVK